MSFATEAELTSWWQREADDAHREALEALSAADRESLRETYNELGDVAGDYGMLHLSQTLGRAVAAFTAVATRAAALPDRTSQQGFVTHAARMLLRLVDRGPDASASNIARYGDEALQLFSDVESMEEAFVRPLAEQGFAAAVQAREELGLDPG